MTDNLVVKNWRDEIIGRLDEFERFANRANIQALYYRNDEAIVQHDGLHNPDAVLARCKQERMLLARHEPIDVPAKSTLPNAIEVSLTLCSYEWRNGEGMLLYWINCPEIHSLTRRLDLDIPEGIGVYDDRADRE